MTMDIEQTFQLGFQLRCDGRYGEARQAFQKVLQVDPNHVDAMHQMGLIQGFEGDFDGSLETLESLSKRNPHNLNLRYDLAMTQMMLGLIDEACAGFKYILAINPSHENALRQSAYC